VKVTNLRKNESLQWKCVAVPNHWIETILNFKLDDIEGKTRVRFEHTNWKKADDFYAGCSFPGGDIMEAFASFVKPGKVRLLGVKDTEDKANLQKTYCAIIPNGSANH
jgi:hypothetical protein